LCIINPIPRHDNKKQKTEVKIAVLSSTIILIWLLAWTPYAIVALLGIFGYKKMITPLVSSIPALFCKTASCIDPFIYAINHPRFQRELRNKFQICYPLAKAKRRSSNDVSYYSNPSGTYRDPSDGSITPSRNCKKRSFPSSLGSSPESTKSRFAAMLSESRGGSVRVPSNGTASFVGDGSGGCSSTTNSPVSITFNLKEMDVGGCGVGGGAVRLTKILRNPVSNNFITTSPLSYSATISKCKSPLRGKRSDVRMKTQDLNLVRSESAGISCSSTSNTNIVSSEFTISCMSKLQTVQGTNKKTEVVADCIMGTGSGNKKKNRNNLERISLGRENDNSSESKRRDITNRALIYSRKDSFDKSNQNKCELSKFTSISGSTLSSGSSESERSVNEIVSVNEDKRVIIIGSSSISKDGVGIRDDLDDYEGSRICCDTNSNNSSARGESICGLFGADEVNVICASDGPDGDDRRSVNVVTKVKGDDDLIIKRDRLLHNAVEVDLDRYGFCSEESSPIKGKEVMRLNGKSKGEIMSTQTGASLKAIHPSRQIAYETTIM
jgi:hypothetical protein